MFNSGYGLEYIYFNPILHYENLTVTIDGLILSEDKETKTM